MPKLTGQLDGVDLFALPKGQHTDQPGRGFYVDVQANGSRSWVYRYKIDGVQEHVWYGTIDKFLGDDGKPDLQLVRQLHLADMALAAQGISPKKKREDAQAALAPKPKVITFKEAAKVWHAKTLASGRWTNERYADDIMTSLTTYVFTPIGDKELTEISRTDIQAVLAPMWHTQKTLATNLRQRMAKVFQHAIATAAEKTPLAELRNPVDLVNLNDALVMQTPLADTRVHHPALPWQELPAFMVGLRANRCVSACALEMLILSVLRIGSLVGGKWDEIQETVDPVTLLPRPATWTIPAKRMKNRKPYVLPLTPRMIEVLNYLRLIKENDYIFPGYKQGKPITAKAVLKFLYASLNRRDLTLHGFRSTMRDWAFEAARDRDGQRFPREVAEQCLTHKIGSDVELSYLRSQGDAMRRELLEAWSVYSTNQPAPTNWMPKRPSNVIPLNATA